jgi:adenylate cyclase
MRSVDLATLAPCFEGGVPAVIATVGADGTPNVTYLSKVRMVDHERVALSNQFFSKTARNLAENPRASVLLVDPITYDEYRLRLVYERTDRRGPVFDQLRADVDALAALQGMEGVFALRAADIYRVAEVEQMPSPRGLPPPAAREVDVPSIEQLSELTARLSRAGDVDTVVTTAVRALSELFGYDHSLLLLLDESGQRLYTIASHGYDAEGVGSEVVVGEGLIGMAAIRAAPMRVGNLGQMEKYSRSVRRTYEERMGITPAPEIPVPGLPAAKSRVAVPAMASGQLVGVLMVESTDPVAFSREDEALLTVVASLVGSAIEVEHARDRTDPAEVSLAGSPPAGPSSQPDGDGPTHVRFFAVDGSTFLDGDYLIKGVAGRLLWALLGHHEREGRTEFTNREVRLDPSLELPQFRDNFESRLVLLQRRLDERDAPVRIEKTGRGRFRLVVTGPIRCEAVAAPRDASTDG